MYSSLTKVRIACLSLAAMVAFAPAAFSAEHGASASSAVCNTCCTEATSTCIVGDIRTNDAYDNGPNKCPAAPAPPTSG